jgi:hypothetical protein
MYTHSLTISSQILNFELKDNVCNCLCAAFSNESILQLLPFASFMSVLLKVDKQKSQVSENYRGQYSNSLITQIHKFNVNTYYMNTSSNSPCVGILINTHPIL